MASWHVTLVFAPIVDADNATEALAQAKKELGLAPMDNRPDQCLVQASAHLVPDGNDPQEIDPVPC